MPCSIIVGAFWGDEGKGKIISYLALKDNLDFCVRTGSVNAAHTIWYEGKKFALHMVPAAFINPKTRLLLAAGSNVDAKVFFDELALTQVDPKRIGIDQNASIIEPKHAEQDKASAVNKGIGTTGRGVGPALEERVRRTAKLAKDIPELKPFLTDQVMEVNDGLDAGKSVLLEGTQGFMLSLFLGGGYPYVTGRDTGASAIASEAGVGPTRVDDVIIVYKSFITRVGAGPLPGEITKEEALKRGWFEVAAGTGRDRRSAPFDFDLAKKTARINGATQAAMTKLDCIYPSCRSARKFDDLPKEAKEFIKEVETRTSVPVAFIGTGPDALDLIDRRA
jgi:adenylosuccinate synthase